MRITDVIWKMDIVEKLSTKHAVSISEVEETFISKPVLRKMARGRVLGEDVYVALAQISSGRYLAVFYIDKKHGVVIPISARDMESAEKRYYAKHR